MDEPLIPKDQVVVDLSSRAGIRLQKIVSKQWRCFKSTVLNDSSQTSKLGNGDISSGEDSKDVS